MAMMACHWMLCFGGTQAAFAQKTFMSPVSGGKIACAFDSTKCASPGKYHAGIDYYGPKYNSVPILASNVGAVHAIILNDGNDHHMGNCVILRHAVIVGSNGSTANLYTLYAHLASFSNGLKVGQAVNRGQVLGMMGSTGDNKVDRWGPTPHLHFEVKSSGVTQNPYGGGPFWGYTKKPAANYGYFDPAGVIGVWKAVPMSSKK